MQSWWQKELRTFCWFYVFITIEILLALLVCGVVLLLTQSNDLALLAGMIASVLFSVSGVCVLVRLHLV